NLLLALLRRSQDANGAKSRNDCEKSKRWHEGHSCAMGVQTTTVLVRPILLMHRIGLQQADHLPVRWRAVWYGPGATDKLPKSLYGARSSSEVQLIWGTQYRKGPHGQSRFDSAGDNRC